MFYFFVVYGVEKLTRSHPLLLWQFRLPCFDECAFETTKAKSAVFEWQIKESKSLFGLHGILAAVPEVATEKLPCGHIAFLLPSAYDTSGLPTGVQRECFPRVFYPQTTPNAML